MGFMNTYSTIELPIFYFGLLSEGAGCLSQRSGLRTGKDFRGEMCGPKYPSTVQSAERETKLKEDTVAH